MKRLKIFFFAALTATLLHGGMANASYIGEAEPNDSLPSAQSINGYFSLDYDADIGDMTGANTSTSIPHVSIYGTGNDSFDYYSFTVGVAGTTGIFDIDYGMPDIDTEIAIWDSTFTPLAQNDDFSSSAGAGGSYHSFDSFIEYLFTSPGTYYVGVATWPSTAFYGGWSGTPLGFGTDYTLHVSLAHPTPEPSTLLLLGGGLAGMYFMRSRKNRR